MCRYQTEFGFTLRERHVVVDDVRIRGVGVSSAGTHLKIPKADDIPVQEKV